MEYRPVKEGKVREIYDLGEELIMVATDRISAFDVILHNTIPDKGKVLTQMSRFWFDLTKDVIKNDLVSVDTADMPEQFRTEAFEGRSTLCKKLTMIPVECIVRGYITGSGWENYKKDGTICGLKLPEGLRECDKLPEPLYTPSTKAELGDHDENISYEQSIVVLEKAFPGRGEEIARCVKDATLAVYKTCADYALERGIIIADTKFEFGLDENGDIVLGDEVLTPDSSRFWRASDYEPGRGQSSFDKQYVRNWLKATKDHGWTLPQEVVDRTAALYKEAYHMLTGEEL
ncbi:MAG: phosphoribosylaminoimidazolesuccinocarboxamide synthase [Lachnospiraceae bacterium]|nr:phosphoribosylaminoimidazolesuccinocarboxamide synthase [Lachnospiraceae bacterium]